MGLLLTPILALANLVVAFALVGPACAQHSVWMLHSVAMTFLAAALLATYYARRHTHSHPRAGSAVSRANFVARVGASTGMLFSVVIIAQWLTVWLLSPCVR